MPKHEFVIEENGDAVRVLGFREDGTVFSYLADSMSGCDVEITIEDAKKEIENLYDRNLQKIKEIEDENNAIKEILKR